MNKLKFFVSTLPAKTMFMEIMETLRLCEVVGVREVIEADGTGAAGGVVCSQVLTYQL